MRGIGEIPTKNVFQSAKEEIKQSIKSIPSLSEVLLVPFADSVGRGIWLSGEAKDSLLSIVDGLRAEGKHSDILTAYQYTIDQIKNETSATVIFITDGYQNGKHSINSLLAELNAYPSSMIDCELYYYLADPYYQDMNICSIFEKNNHMHLVTSIQFAEVSKDTSTVSSLAQVPIDNSKKCKMNLSWLLWVLLAILGLGAIYLLVRYVFPYIGFGSVMIPSVRAVGNVATPSTSGNLSSAKQIEKEFLSSNDRCEKVDKLMQLSNMKEDLVKQGRREEADAIHNSLSPETQRCLDKVESSKRTPENNNNGTWVGEKGNGLYKANPNSEYGKDMQRINQEGVQYNNGIPNFDKASYCTVNGRDILNNASNKQLDARGGGANSIQERAADLMSRDMGSTLKEFWSQKFPGEPFDRMKAFWAFKDDPLNPKVIHETIDGRFQLLSTATHEACKHMGFISVGKTVMSNG